jgi:MFS superfamily sulfate permease-like transporter
VLEKLGSVESPRFVVCDLSNSPYIDVAGAAMLKSMHKELTSRGVQLRIVEAHAKGRDLLRAEGLEAEVGYFGRHMSVDQAIGEFVGSSNSGLVESKET